MSFNSCSDSIEMIIWNCHQYIYLRCRLVFVEGDTNLTACFNNLIVGHQLDSLSVISSCIFHVLLFFHLVSFTKFHDIINFLLIVISFRNDSVIYAILLLSSLHSTPLLVSPTYEIYEFVL